MIYFGRETVLKIHIHAGSQSQSRHDNEIDENELLHNILVEILEGDVESKQRGRSNEGEHLRVVLRHLLFLHCHVQPPTTYLLCENGHIRSNVYEANRNKDGGEMDGHHHEQRGK